MSSLKLTLVALLVALCLQACGNSSTEEQAERAAATTQSPGIPDTGSAVADRTPAPDGARVFFISPADGATVSNPVRIEFGIEGMSVAKAGDNQPNSGHHHLLIDTALPAMGAPIPADANHIHFGDGSTSTEISLEPGEHTLRLLLGDYLHRPHDPPLVSKAITITVK